MSILELTEALSQRSRDIHRTLQLLDAVIVAVQAAPPGGNLRELLLRSLYLQAESEDERVFVGVARAMLTVCAYGSMDFRRRHGIVNCYGVA